ncbi:MAG: hypothetical protein ACRYF0_17505 [Janthinobacterium lividum]
MSNYQLDFDQVAQVGRNTRHRPTFPLRQLDQAVDKTAGQSYTVQTNMRHHHGEWYLPLYEAHVRAWLKKQQFTEPPVVLAGGVEITCSKEAAPDG